MPNNTLYYGDNLEVMRKHLPDASVDLVYLDPPFNSNRDYNLLFREQSGEPAQGQIKAFTDSWQWSERAYDEFCQTCPLPALVELVQGFVRTLGRNDLTAYLVMMAPRLVELHRVLKPTGSLYLHCDPTASHYLKVMLDVIFGARHFRNEIVWKRTSAHSSARRWGDVHDILLFYSKTENYTWNAVFQPHEAKHVESKYTFADTRGRYMPSDLTGAGRTSGDSGKSWRGYDPSALGRHWAVPRKIVEELVGKERASQMTTQEKLDLLDAHGYIHWPAQGKGFPRFKKYLSEGTLIQDVITDIPPINSQARERLGYPTQKPLALLERILQASSNAGDTVLDPFCGCGTAIVAAQKLNRRWIGIDITHLAIADDHQASRRHPFAEERPGIDQQMHTVRDRADRPKIDCRRVVGQSKRSAQRSDPSYIARHTAFYVYSIRNVAQPSFRNTQTMQAVIEEAGIDTHPARHARQLIFPPRYYSLLPCAAETIRLGFVVIAINIQCTPALRRQHPGKPIDRLRLRNVDNVGAQSDRCQRQRQRPAQ